MGVAYRRYYTSPRHDDDRLESWLEPRDGRAAAARLRLDLRHGRRHLNVGLGILNTSEAFGQTDYHDLLYRGCPPAAGGVGLHPREQRPARFAVAALPMGFNRKPHYAEGACCSPATPAAWSTH